MRLNALMEGLPLTCLAAGDAEVVDLATDSRAVRPGTLFVARQGWFVDSHAFLAAAVEAGASALVVTNPNAIHPAWGVPVWLAAHEDRDVGLLADRFFGHPTRALWTVGVTGTNGKTSVTWLLRHMLEATGALTGLVGTVQNQLGDEVFPTRNTTPDGHTLHKFAARCRDQGAQALVLETSSHGIQLERIAGVAFDVVAFTQLTADHLDFHTTMEAYEAAKRLLFTRDLAASLAAGKSPVAVAMDNEVGRRMLAAVPDGVRTVRVIVADAPPVAGTELGGDTVVLVPTGTAALDGVAFSLWCGGVYQGDGHCGLPGDFNLQNVALALAIVFALAPDRVRAALDSVAHFAAIPGRMERVARWRADEPVVLVDYAHTPDAVARALAALTPIGAVAAVLGCGGDRDRTKRPLMTAAALAHATEVVLTADNPRSEPVGQILHEMTDGVEGAESAVQIPSRQDAIAQTVVQTKAPVVALLGKGHETYQESAGVRCHLDDREEARRALRARRSGVPADEVPLLAGWSPQRLARAMDGRLVQPGPLEPLGGLSIDSRTTQVGDVFVALAGARHDAHQHLPAVVAAGAQALVVHQPVEAAPECAIVQVPQTDAALLALGTAVLADARARRPSLRTIGVTGSNGKTTAKEILRALVASSLGDPKAVLATEGNFNNHIGLPLTLARLAACHSAAVLELGANQPNDIAELSAVSRHEVAVVTSIGAAHVGGFGGLDGVRRAKAGIVSGGGVAAHRPRAVVLPHGESRHPIWREAVEGLEVWTVGGAGADIVAHRSAPFAPVVLTAPHRWGADWRLEVPLDQAGDHLAELIGICVAAHALALHDGAAPDASTLAAALATVRWPAGRLSKRYVGEVEVYDDSYNANPTSMLAALRVLRASSQPRVAVLGDMYELGEDEVALHQQVGRQVAGHAEVLITVGPRARWMAEAAAERAREALEIHQVETALDALPLLQRLRAGTVLFKASRSMALDRLLAAWAASPES